MTEAKGHTLSTTLSTSEGRLWISGDDSDMVEEGYGNHQVRSYSQVDDLGARPGSVGRRGLDFKLPGKTR